MKNSYLIEVKEELARALRWTIFVRFILYGIALIIAFQRAIMEGSSFNPCFIYLTSVIYTLNVIYLLFISKKCYLYFIAHFSLIIDLFAITYALHIHSGLASVIFPINYLVVILAASILISQKSGLIITTVASILLAGLIALEYYQIFPISTFYGFEAALYNRGGYVLLTVISKIIFFYAVAITSGYLSDKLKRQAIELKEKEEELIEREKLATASLIAQEVAHDLKNQLAVIKTGLYYLAMFIPKEKKALDAISKIELSISRGLNFINSLLNFSKPFKLNVTDISVNQIIKEIIGELLESNLCGIEVSQNLDLALPLISADFERIKDVLANLIRNAAEAMERVETKRLEIKTQQWGDFVKVAISDTGEGIKEEDLSLIFTPFYSTKSIGTGLGLSIVKRLVVAHKGEIKVTSEQGKGTTFIIKLPLSSDPHS